jgi:hypothetical protein
MKDKKSDDIQWHNALLPSLQLELEAYFDDLRFESRHELNTKHLEIDLIIIVLKKNIVIDNPIARIFKTYNIFEYKSPTVSLSIADFQRALSYVLLYESIEKDGESKQIDIDEISLSIITTIHPKAVFDYYRNQVAFQGRGERIGYLHSGRLPLSATIHRKQEIVERKQHIPEKFKHEFR